MSSDNNLLQFGLSEVFIPPIPAAPKGLVSDPEFSRFRDDVYATLHSQIKGFPDICDLMRCYNADTGKDPLAMARKFGYASFGDFLCSDEMKGYVDIVASSTHDISYHAAEREPFMHIRKEQLTAFHDLCLKRSQREGVCDARRVRPKLFEVARLSRWEAAFSGVATTDAIQPDILFRPGPAARFRASDTSVWDDDNDKIEEWGEKLCANVEPFTPNPSYDDLDWGYEEVPGPLSQKEKEKLKQKEYEGKPKPSDADDDEEGIVSHLRPCTSKASRQSSSDGDSSLFSKSTENLPEKSPFRTYDLEDKWII